MHADWSVAFRCVSSFEVIEYREWVGLESCQAVDGNQEEEETHEHTWNVALVKRVDTGQNTRWEHLQGSMDSNQWVFFIAQLYIGMSVTFIYMYTFRYAFHVPMHEFTHEFIYISILHVWKDEYP